MDTYLEVSITILNVYTFNPHSFVLIMKNSNVYHYRMIKYIMTHV